VKKSFVLLLLALALIVIVSPGIVGRLAETSMDENLDWAATESQELTITSRGFDRSWFSSAGQHRIEVRDGELRDALMALARDSGFDELPALIIDTRIDHGLVPVTSLSRQRGSLTPGLGSAVSTLNLELPDGNTIDFPATIYSKVGLGGELQSNLVMNPGTFTDGSETLGWGDIDLTVTMNPSSGAVTFDAAIGEVLLSSPGSEIGLANIAFAGERQQTRFGFAVGDASLSIESIAFPSALGRSESGPLQITSTAAIDNDRLSGRTTIAVDHVPLDNFGPSSIGLDVSIDGVDAAAISRITDAIDNFDRYGSGDALLAAVDADLGRLLAGGFSLQVERLAIAAPPGTISATLDAEVAPTDVGRFAMTSLLLALDAELELRIPVEFYDYAAALDPQVSTAVGMGFLRRSGDEYRMRAVFRDGLLTVNDAPMPGLIPGLR
jgi:uncharacterized protein YdgA (DUF945 family)